MLMKVGKTAITNTIGKIDEIPPDIIDRAMENPPEPLSHGMFPTNEEIRAWLKKEPGFNREFCDLDCRHAEFPESDAVDGSKSCRTFIALHCRKKRTLVHKNLPCRDKEARK